MTTSHKNLGSYTICPHCNKGLIITAVKKTPLYISNCCDEPILIKEWLYPKGRKARYTCAKCKKPCDMRTGLRVTNEDNYNV